MIYFAPSISPQFMHTLAWALLHFLWEGLALAALCSALMAVYRTASARYIIGLSTLALMLAAPVVTFFVIQRAPRAAPDFAVSAAVAAIWHPSALSAATSAPGMPQAPLPPVRPDALLLLVEAWFAGVVFFSLRTAGGFFVVERMRRHHSRPVSAMLLEKCLALQRYMGIGRAIRFCECLRLETPAVVGWFRPVVLLPITVLSGLSEEQLAAVISHELAHIRRFDSFANLFQIAVETVLFYHPAVWWLSKRIRVERENCCDDAALAVCGNAVEYARALTLMEEWRQAPAMAMAANRSPLVARVGRLLGIGSQRSGIRTAGVAASVLCLAGALLAGNGLMAAGRSTVALGESGPLYQSTPLKAVDTSRFTQPAAQPSVATPSPSRSARAAEHLDNAESTLFARSEQSRQGQSEGQGQSSGQSQGQGQGQGSGSSYVDRMKAEGLNNLTADQLIALKVQGVTPEYVKEVKALGLNVTVNELIAMKVQGIDPQYIKDMRATGFNADINQLIGMRVQGVTPEYIRNMRAAGVDGDANKFIGMRVQGLTPDYVKEMKAAGLNASSDQLIGMKVQGVTPEYIRDMRAVGVDGDVNQFIGMRVQGLSADYVKEMKAAGINASPNQLIGMKVQGLTPEYISQMKAIGVNADANQLIGMRVQGLTPEYVKEMKAVGVTAGPNQLIGMRVQGLTPDYVKEMKASGVNADTDQLIGMRVQGVTPEYVKALQDAGLQNLKANDYISARVMGITPEFIKTVRDHGFKDLTVRKLIDLKQADIF